MKDSRLHSSLAALVLAIGVVVPRTSQACGSSGPDGVSACSLADYEDAQRPRWRLGISGVYTSTVIRFSSTLQTGETRFASVAELAYSPTSRLTLSAGLGGAAAGKLLAPDGAHDFSPGLVASLGVSYRLLDGKTPLGRGFLVTSGLVSITTSSTQRADEGPSTAYDALDLRAGLAGGFTWLRMLSAYGVVRAFGGPVYWAYGGESQLGTDTHHYQAGGGLALLLAKRLDLFVEGVPLGEQAIAAGAAMNF
jgi:hypothetical protein